METKLKRIAQNKSSYPGKYVNLIRFVNESSLREAFRKLDGKKAVGVDGVSKAKYGERLEENLQDLVQRMKRSSYKPQPARRKYIPKGNRGKLRPLGIPSLEDKLVQSGMAEVLNTIYEPLFYPFSYGFRPNRNCHQAIKELDNMIFRNPVNYIVDTDIKGFFDHVDHKVLIQFLEAEIGDKSFLRYIVRFLKSGVMEEGKFMMSEEGTPQGSLISPILANVYLHYALDMWFEVVVKKYCRGFCGMVRYADDFVCSFQYEAEAREFFAKLAERLKKFNLEVEESKSKIIRFGRNAGEQKGTYDFLGFTFISGKSRKGKYTTIRRTSKKKMSAKLQAMNQWIKENRHMPVKELITKLNQKLRGHYQYYGIKGNYVKLAIYWQYTINRLKVWLGKRSQKAKMTWEKFHRILEFSPLLRPKIYNSI
ncbi:group II intron reverse transcriptase/maturase [Holdemania massiliensis]|uniref:group II intron reverse transcriptase/maturase n=1 Tax=Holdemania massiliensis TaxID=1468449 RepID=UPI002675096A|nr:group II intron reverse transcriptase/maturase [Holdemania massiliensis]